LTKVGAAHFFFWEIRVNGRGGVAEQG